MFKLKFVEIVGDIFLGYIAGTLAATALMIWGSALWMIIGENRSLRELSYKKPHHPLIALKRLILAMPLIALFNPFPWLVIGIIWFLFSLLSGQSDPGLSWFGLSFFGQIIWMVWRFSINP